MRLSPEGTRFIQSEEGLMLKAYRDADGWSIGYGHYLGTDPSNASKVIDRAEADRLFTSDIARFENVVSLATSSPSQNEFDAMVSLTYNIGTGDKDKGGGFWGSTVRRLHNLGDKLGAADAFRMWNKSTRNGVRSEDPVLVKRREKERNVYLNGFSPAGSFPIPPAPESTPGWPELITEAPAPSAPAYRSAGVMAVVTLGLGWLVWRLTH